ncbi:F-type H+-transporting ATPase subunit gamma [Devosia sp. UYZn731]|uniref:F0F1 ATP synthase subunit gamma n=1 Tax=Devosia sp. UYZn731 TaxID=3156345 RepID=UPI003397A7AC
MSASIADLRKTIGSAEDLHSVVRTMKALAASSIAQYEQSTSALDDYYRTVELGLSVCIRTEGSGVLPDERGGGGAQVVVFGSDQGLVGRFNDIVADHAIAMLANMPKAEVWVVGERVSEPLQDAGLTMAGLLGVPLSVAGITPLVGQILVDYEAALSRGEVSQLHLVYNRPAAGAVYEPVTQRLLPLDETWRSDLKKVVWPTKALPEVMGEVRATLSEFVREYLFVSVFRACAASLASENASRLAAMQRADKNIDSLLEELSAKFHRLRQDEIDEELFDVVAGYEAMRS